MSLGLGFLGSARTARTASAFHWSSADKRCTVRTRMASPDSNATMCSPVRGYTPSHMPGRLRAASFFFPRDAFFLLPGFLKDNRPITDSPKWNIWPFQDFPVNLLHGVKPSWPTWNLVRTKAACLTSHLTIGSETSTLHLSFASSPRISLLMMSVTSCTAFSAPPLACGV